VSIVYLLLYLFNTPNTYTQNLGHHLVGGGVVCGCVCSGLGAALEIDTIMNQEMRDKWCGGSKITVVEKAQTVSSYDPNKGFMYLVSALGLKFTDRHGLSGVSFVSCHMEAHLP